MGFPGGCRRALTTETEMDVLAHGEMRLLVLHLLVSEGPIGRAEIGRRVAGRLAPAGLEAAPVDDVIEMLERLDYLRPFAQGQAFGITEDGVALLDANRVVLASLLQRLDGGAGAVSEADAVVLRALAGFGLALRLSLVAGRLPRRRARRIARALQALTVQVELT